MFPVTFALHTMLLREHNACCNTTAPELGYEGDEVRVFIGMIRGSPGFSTLDLETNRGACRAFLYCLHNIFQC